jgi:hypothetical protein
MRLNSKTKSAGLVVPEHEEFVARRTYNPKKSPIWRFFTLQTPKAALKLWFFAVQNGAKTYKRDRPLAA